MFPLRKLEPHKQAEYDKVIMASIFQVLLNDANTHEMEIVHK